MSNDLPSARAAGGTALKYGLVAIMVLALFGAVAWGVNTVFWAATKPIDTARGLVNRVIDPDHALQTYRWFHEANQQIKAKVGQIALSKVALDAAAPDRKEARRVELLGLQQGCQSLIAEYNARATRADTVIFKHPEQFLPGNWPGERSPLPESVELEACL